MFESVSSSRFFSSPIQDGNFPLTSLFPRSDSRVSDFIPAHSLGILPDSLFFTSNPLSPRYRTSSDFIFPMLFGSDPLRSFALRSK